MRLQPPIYAGRLLGEPQGRLERRLLLWLSLVAAGFLRSVVCCLPLALCRRRRMEAATHAALAIPA